MYRQGAQTHKQMHFRKHHLLTQLIKRERESAGCRSVIMPEADRLSKLDL